MSLDFPIAQLRTRLAPTPSGFLHIGNAYSFVLTWLVARQSGSTILLRIDDLDASRKRAEFVADIFESIDWLGIDYDEGPTGPDDFESNFSQQHRIDLYREQLSRLRAADELFGCACSRSSIQRTLDGLHPTVVCQTRKTNLDAEDVAWRTPTSPTRMEWTDIDSVVRSVDLHTSMRDIVVQRKDGIPAYQLASLVDDRHFDISLIVRGDDLLESTAAQRWLADKLKFNHFINASFLHHSIVPDSSGNKLSKSAGATSLKSMRSGDKNPAALFREIASFLNLPASISSASEALAAWCMK